jgi:energy-coupling factor transport system permease/ATP-binding protein
MIRCSGVSYRYPNGHGIHNVDVKIPGRSIYLLAGLNGSGKSTFLKVLAGGLKKYTGEIRVDDIDIKESPISKNRRFTVALSPQQPETQFSLPTVRDELRLTAHATKTPVDSELELRILEALLLEPYLDHSPFDLTPVKRKLLSLAIAAVIPSPFIALDEPTAGIDPEHKPLVLQFIRFLHTYKGVIIVSHDIDTFLPIASHIGIMNEGTIIESIDTRTFVEHMLSGHYNHKIIRPFIVPRIARFLIQQPALSIDELTAKIIQAVT